jgi:hypothetical protein
MHINCLSSDVTLSSQNPRDAVWSEEERGFFNMDAASTAHTNLTIGCTAWNPLVDSDPFTTLSTPTL